MDSEAVVVEAVAAQVTAVGITAEATEETTVVTPIGEVTAAIPTGQTTVISPRSTRILLLPVNGAATTPRLPRRKRGVTPMTVVAPRLLQAASVDILHLLPASVSAIPSSAHLPDRPAGTVGTMAAGTVTEVRVDMARIKVVEEVVVDIGTKRKARWCIFEA